MTEDNISLENKIPLASKVVQHSDRKEELSGISTVLKYGILAMICILAFSIRLFAVLRYESVIHEFDPYFNFRATKFLAHEGFLEFLNWFDDRGWYPLGRTIGGTIYPGLMLTAAVFYWVAHALRITVNIRNVCVFIAPIFSANAALSSYLITTEVTKKSSAGLLAAAFTAIVPSYISRSVGGSYDNEGVAIFALIFCFYLWIKAVHTGSIMWSCLSALAYYYMVASWGGYVFIINMIPIYIVIMILSGRYSHRLYIAYSIFYTFGSLMAMTIPFVGFNVIKQAECASSHGVFIALQIFAILHYLYNVSAVNINTIKKLLFGISFIIVCIVAYILISLQYNGTIQWSGRSLTLLDPTYASKYIPIIASVSEHQPTSWTSFFFDLHILVPFSVVGLLVLFMNITDGGIFIILYGTIAWYFAGVMVRLMLTLAPIACILSAIGISAILTKLSAMIKNSHIAAMMTSFKTSNTESDVNNDKENSNKNSYVIFSPSLAVIIILAMTSVLLMFNYHATFAASVAYSSPSVVIDAGQDRSGRRILFDDYREAYFWLRQNTDENAKILSWWDYGYQMSAMANRTVLVDNNTWNNTHIATVGRALATSEEEAYPIFESLDVDYVLVIFGGVTGYSSDDINKFLWPVRIGGGVFPNDMPHENEYFNSAGFDIGPQGSPTLHNCVAYKLCYYRFGELQTSYGRPLGYDMARNKEVGVKRIELTTLEEAFTSEHWIVRIYKVKPRPNLQSTAKYKQKITKMKLSGSSNSFTSPTNNAKDESKYVGCFTSESFFGDKIYGGGSTGANYNLAAQHAKAHSKKYFAIARNGADGHSFSFNKLIIKNKDHKSGDTSGQGCERPCVDYPNKVCGCVDSTCSGPKPPGEDNNRRWAVYELLSSPSSNK